MALHENRGSQVSLLDALLAFAIHFRMHRVDASYINAFAVRRRDGQQQEEEAKQMQDVEAGK